MFNRLFSGSWRLSEGLSKKKIFVVVGVFMGALSLSMYAASSLPVSPSGSPAGGTLSSRFTHMAQSCPARTFLKGFDGNHNPVCASYKPSVGGANASSVSLVSGGSYPAPLSGQSNGGFLATFLSNLSGTCPSGYIVKGFVADGKKVCESSTPPFNTIAVSASSSPSLTAGPTNSGMMIPKYITFATKIATSCTSGETAVTGIAADGTVSCGTIPVDGGWSGWSGWSDCNALCNGGTQSRSRSCNSPSPRNGGDGCSGSSSDSQSCNTQACPVSGACWSSANTCNSGSPSGYSAGSCGGSATWSCNGSNGWSSISCSVANGACKTGYPPTSTPTTPVLPPPPSNCSSTVLSANGHNYSVWAMNHGESTTGYTSTTYTYYVTMYSPLHEPHLWKEPQIGTHNYRQSFTCSNGTISASGGEQAEVCTPGPTICDQYGYNCGSTPICNWQ